jgi:hypothetical protein
MPIAVVLLQSRRQGAAQSAIKPISRTSSTIETLVTDPNVACEGMIDEPRFGRGIVTQPIRKSNWAIKATTRLKTATTATLEVNMRRRLKVTPTKGLPRYILKARTRPGGMAPISPRAEHRRIQVLRVGLLSPREIMTKSGFLIQTSADSLVV